MVWVMAWTKVLRVLGMVAVVPVRRREPNLTGIVAYDHCSDIGSQQVPRPPNPAIARCLGILLMDHKNTLHRERV